MSLLLIDDQGTKWDGSSRQLRVAFDSPYSGGEFVQYAILNLGFIAINVYGASCQIRVRPAMVGDKALDALRQWLTQSKTARCVLSIYFSEWSSELIASPLLALSRVEQLVGESRRAQPQDFLARKVDPNTIADYPVLAMLMREWNRLSNVSGQHVLLNKLKQAFDNRYVMVKKDMGQGSIVFNEVGNGLFTNYETWRACAIGAPVEEQPDRNYGRWIAHTYSDALRAPEPVLEDIDAIVRWPHSGRTRLRYKRLMLPLTHEDGSQLLLSASVMDNRIDLRIANGA